MFKGLPGALIRSFVSKTFPAEDIAKVFFLLCAVESAGPLVAPILYNSLYGVTLEVFPGAIYVLSAIMLIAALVMLG